jgi:hypothetical protein
MKRQNILFDARFEKKTPATVADGNAHIAIFSRHSTPSVCHPIVVGSHPKTRPPSAAFG